MSAMPTTPSRSRTMVPSTPTTSRIANTSTSTVQASPHYATTRRHSLYGVEDRIIIDPGSRIWKVGFSGEGRPRDVLYADGKHGAPLWKLNRATNPAERAEEDRMLDINLERALRSVFHDSLLTDPKARKVILVEHPLLPLYIKEMMTKILFENLLVPSVSFASSHLLALFAVGRITGLVLDCGHQESTVLPIFAARPLFPYLRTTPLAGAALSLHLSQFIHVHGSYVPPPTTLSAHVNVPAANRTTRVPAEVLTPALVEEIKTRACFVSGPPGIFADREHTPAPELSSEPDIPSSENNTDSDFSFAGRDSMSSQPESSDFSVVSTPARNPLLDDRRSDDPAYRVVEMYERCSTASHLTMRVPPPSSQNTATGYGALIIPGWVRERSAELLFDGGDVDESSVAEVILESLLKIPVDLRKTMASSILVVGGTSMLPGFIPRLQTEILRALAPPTSPVRLSTPPGRPTPPQYDKYAALRPLTPYFAILNNPAPPTSQSERAKVNAGKAPAFTPSTMAWIGGSLAGSLKTGGAELSREKWDEAAAAPEDEEVDRQELSILPDWTRSPLPAGAPSARMERGMPQATVGA
ncbi:fungal-specific actin related protein [Mucidula mucida]|nr:fungal-specific actin related protein [Mucidula mucida]